MSKDLILLCVWNKEDKKEGGYDRTALSSINQMILTNKSTAVLLLFTKEPMLYWSKSHPISDKLAEVCNTEDWNGTYKVLRYGSLPAEAYEGKISRKWPGFIKSKMEEWGYQVGLRIMT